MEIEPSGIFSNASIEALSIAAILIKYSTENAPLTIKITHHQRQVLLCGTIHSMNNDPYFVYILECADGSLYTGIATDVERRFKEHAMGKGSKYVKARGAKQILYTETCTDKGAALKREFIIKKLSRQEKMLLTK